MNVVVGDLKILFMDVLLQNAALSECFYYDMKLTTNGQCQSKQRNIS